MEYEYPNGIRATAIAAQIRGMTPRVYNRIEGTKGIGEVDRATAVIKGDNPWQYRSTGPRTPEQSLFASLIHGIRDGKPMNDGKLVAEATMTAIMGRMSAYTGRAMKWDWALEASQLDLSPDKYELGDLPVGPVAMPGQTQLV